MLELARESDWEEVQRLSVQVHDMHVAWRPDLYRSADAPFPKASFLEQIQKRMIYVAKIRDQVVGYVFLSIGKKEAPGIVSRKVMHLESICVEEMLRGQGIGKAMVADLRALARAFACQELTLSVHAENDKAVGFYQKCGFRIRCIQMDMKL